MPKGMCLEWMRIVYEGTSLLTHAQSFGLPKVYSLGTDLAQASTHVSNLRVLGLTSMRFASPDAQFLGLDLITGVLQENGRSVGQDSTVDRIRRVFRLETHDAGP